MLNEYENTCITVMGIHEVETTFCVYLDTVQLIYHCDMSLYYVLPGIYSIKYITHWKLLSKDSFYTYFISNI